MNTIEDLAKTILGGTYGGPSLSYEEDTNEFVVYRWYDAPVGDTIIGRGETIEAALKEAINSEL